MRCGPTSTKRSLAARAGGGTRTHGLSFTRALLFQLSYSGAPSAYKTRPVLSDTTTNCVCMEHPKEIGDRSTLAAMLGLKAAGYALLVPFGENTRYDLVVDDGRRARSRSVQDREAARRSDRLRGDKHVRPPSEPGSPFGVTYSGEIDYFAVYCPETTGVYLVPIDESPRARSPGFA